MAGRAPRWGYRQLHDALRRAGYAINHKLTYRIYQEEGLALRRRYRRRQRSAATRLQRAHAVNERWSMDFVTDALQGGRQFRVLNVIDEYSRNAYATEVSRSFTGAFVCQVLKKLIRKHGRPKSIRVDNGPEFTSRIMRAWAHAHQITLLYIEPGKPVQNAFVESFNGRFRDECLNLHWFRNISDARSKIETWRHTYNRGRSHSALGRRTPAEFLADLTRGSSNDRISPTDLSVRDSVSQQLFT